MPQCANGDIKELRKEIFIFPARAWYYCNKTWKGGRGEECNFFIKLGYRQKKRKAPILVAWRPIHKYYST
jgi:hypothetical protein